MQFYLTKGDSVDYVNPPPPSDMSNYQKTHITTDNLRLRDNPGTVGNIITTLDKEMGVQLLETGVTVTIDGITAPWVKVLSESGYTGWCFSGYLVPVAVEKENNVVNLIIESDIQYSKPENKRTFPLLWVLIGIAIIVLSGIVIFFVKKRKK